MQSIRQFENSPHPNEAKIVISNSFALILTKHFSTLLIAFSWKQKGFKFKWLQATNENKAISLYIDDANAPNGVFPNKKFGIKNDMKWLKKHYYKG